MTPAAPLEPHPDRLLSPDPGVRAIARRQVAVITDSLDRIARVTSVRALGLLALGRATQLTDAVDQLTWTDEASQVSIKPDAATATTYADVHRPPTTDVRHR
jgi:hypothetical protein